jgi:hypothetical protein
MIFKQSFLYNGLREPISLDLAKLGFRLRLRFDCGLIHASQRVQEGNR